jgi:hypothetical protein
MQLKLHKLLQKYSTVRRGKLQIFATRMSRNAYTSRGHIRLQHSKRQHQQRCHQNVDHRHDNNDDSTTNQPKHDGRTKVSWRASASDVSCENHQYAKGSLQSHSTTSMIVGCAPKTICRFQFPCLNARLEDTAMSNEVRLN